MTQDADSGRTELSGDAGFAPTIVAEPARRYRGPRTNRAQSRSAHTEPRIRARTRRLNDDASVVHVLYTGFVP
jgi:hypothetical protein